MTKRQRQAATLLVLVLLFTAPVVRWGYPTAAHLYAAMQGDVVDGEELEREMAEIGRLMRERAGTGAPAAAEPLVWPAPGNEGITSEFGLREHPILRRPLLHAGLDIGAPEGAEVVASLDGEVILVESFAAYGQIIAIDHGGQLGSVYAHLSEVAVKEGDRVSQGQRIGSVGSTGQVTGPHLHFEVRQNGEPVDPASLVALPQPQGSQASNDRWWRR